MCIANRAYPSPLSSNIGLRTTSPKVKDTVGDNPRVCWRGTIQPTKLGIWVERWSKVWGSHWMENTVTFSLLLFFKLFGFKLVNMLHLSTLAQRVIAPMCVSGASEAQPMVHPST